MENEFTAIISALLEDNRMLNYKLSQINSELAAVNGKLESLKAIYSDEKFIPRSGVMKIFGLEETNND